MSAIKNICLWCKTDCTFLSFTDGLCMACADRMMSAGNVWILKQLAVNTKALMDVTKALEGQENKLQQARKSNFELVREFHQAFGVPIIYYPTKPLSERKQLRMSLLREEFTEVMQAIGYLDVEQIAKELADLLIIVYGTAHEYGIQLDRVMEEVHRSNMSKLGDDGKPVHRDDGKVLKGPNYKEPDLRDIISDKTPNVPY